MAYAIHFIVAELVTTLRVYVPTAWTLATVTAQSRDNGYGAHEALTSIFNLRA